MSEEAGMLLFEVNESVVGWREVVRRVIGLEKHRDGLERHAGGLVGELDAVRLRRMQAVRV